MAPRWMSPVSRAVRTPPSVPTRRRATSERSLRARIAGGGSAGGHRISSACAPSGTASPSASGATSTPRAVHRREEDLPARSGRRGPHRREGGRGDEDAFEPDRGRRVGQRAVVVDVGVGDDRGAHPRGAERAEGRGDLADAHRGPGASPRPRARRRARRAREGSCRPRPAGRPPARRRPRGVGPRGQPPRRASPGRRRRPPRPRGRAGAPARSPQGRRRSRRRSTRRRAGAGRSARGGGRRRPRPRRARHRARGRARAAAPPTASDIGRTTSAASPAICSTEAIGGRGDHRERRERVDRAGVERDDRRGGDPDENGRDGQRARPAAHEAGDRLVARLADQRAGPRDPRVTPAEQHHEQGGDAERELEPDREQVERAPEDQRRGDPPQQRDTVPAAGQQVRDQDRAREQRGAHDRACARGRGRRRPRSRRARAPPRGAGGRRSGAPPQRSRRPRRRGGIPRSPAGARCPCARTAPAIARRGDRSPSSIAPSTASPGAWRSASSASEARARSDEATRSGIAARRSAMPRGRDGLDRPRVGPDPPDAARLRGPTRTRRASRGSGRCR
jgi:hypothetical protein